jgi:signal transduction histidine kinase
MQSNVIELNLEKFDLNETIETVVNRFSYLEELDKYKFEYKGIKKAYILADKKKIEQVIYNLISNATNYVGEDKKVIVKLQEFEDVYHVEVIDHGKGINKEDLNLIWDKYYRVDKKHKRNTIGTGLGLSIVKNIFIMHNIDYGVFSKKGKGTTFYFNVKKED